jgi:hypothetical protein
MPALSLGDIPLVSVDSFTSNVLPPIRPRGNVLVNIKASLFAKKHRESLSDAMVSCRLSVRGLCLDNLFIFLIFFILFFYLEGMLIKLQWPALFQTLVFSAYHPRNLLLSINGCILLKLKSKRSASLSVGSVAVDLLIAN